MKKYTFAEIYKIIDLHNKSNNIVTQFTDKQPITFYIVYKASNFKKEFTEQERTYRVRSDNKYFIGGLGGNSIFGDCLDNKDLGVRLDWYNWEIDYCYLPD